MIDDEYAPPPRALTAWLATVTFSPGEIDCVTAVMLKILDGKCKMPAGEIQVMTQLYDAVHAQVGARLGGDYHQLIAAARADVSEASRAAVYEQRVLAETMISRPVMKAFKARLRQAGVLPPP